MKGFKLEDYTPPPEGWVEFYKKYGKEGAIRYLSDERHLLPAIRYEWLAWRREHPKDRILPNETQPFSPLSLHRVGKPRISPKKQ